MSNWISNARNVPSSVPFTFPFISSWSHPRFWDKLLSFLTVYRIRDDHSLFPDFFFFFFLKFLLWPAFICFLFGFWILAACIPRLPIYCLPFNIQFNCFVFTLDCLLFRKYQWAVTTSILILPALTSILCIIIASLLLLLLVQGTCLTLTLCLGTKGSVLIVYLSKHTEIFTPFSSTVWSLKRIKVCLCENHKSTIM